MTHEYPLPSLDEQLDLLRTTGDQFDIDERRGRRVVLPGVTLEEDGIREPALYDAGVVPTIQTMVVPDERVCDALANVRPGMTTMASATPFLMNVLQYSGLVVGFSGYGTGSSKEKTYEYQTEHAGINGVLDAFEESGLRVAHVVDGGTGYGVPGLSGVIAEQRGLRTIGYAPVRSLRGIARRDTSVIVGNEFGDEAVALGSTPDVLVALGGGPNAEKEVEAALNVGSKVMLLTLKDYPGNSIAYLPERHEAAREAQDKEQLVVCTSLEEAREHIQAMNIDDLFSNRYVYRLPILRRALATVSPEPR
jgi:hypothetical protein